MGSAPGGPRRPHPLPLAFPPNQTQTRNPVEPPLSFPLPHAGPQTPTSAPTDPPTSCHCLGLNPSSAPAAWRALPGRGLRGPRAALSCPEGWGWGPGLGAGLGPPASAAWACLSVSSLLQKPGELIKNRWAGRGGSGWLATPALPRQPSAAGSFLPRPFAAAAVAAASPAGSGYCNQCRAPPALPMPRSCRGLGWPPLPGPSLDADGRNLGCFPQKPAPICF